MKKAWPFLASLLFWIGEWQQLFVIVRDRSAQDVSSFHWLLVTLALIGWFFYYARCVQDKIARQTLMLVTLISVCSCLLVLTASLIY